MSRGPGYRQGDPQAIRTFASDLKLAVEQAEDKFSWMSGRLEHMETLGEWSDENHRRYQDEFQDALKDVLKAMSLFKEDQFDRLHRLARDYEDVSY